MHHVLSHPDSESEGSEEDMDLLVNRALGHTKDVHTMRERIDYNHFSYLYPSSMILGPS